MAAADEPGTPAGDAVAAAEAELAAAEAEVKRLTAQGSGSTTIGSQSEASAAALNAACSQVERCRAKLEKAKKTLSLQRGGFPRQGSSYASGGGTPVHKCSMPGTPLRTQLTAKEAAEDWGFARQMSAEVDPQVQPQQTESAEVSSPKAEKESELSQFEEGTLVETHGLKKQELNGKRGRVIGLDEKKCRVQVHLGGGLGSKAVKPVNLHVITETTAPLQVADSFDGFGDPSDAQLQAAVEASERMLQSWKMHIEEPSSEHKCEKMSTAFDGFVYPLEGSLLPHLLGRVAVHLCDTEETRVLSKSGTLDHLRRAVKRGICLKGPEDTELLQQALVARLADAVQARLVPLRPRVLTAVKEAGVGRPDLSSGAALTILLDYLRTEGTGAILVVEDPAELLESASLCDVLRKELQQESSRNMIMVLKSKSVRKKEKKESRPFSATIPLAPAVEEKDAEEVESEKDEEEEGEEGDDDMGIGKDAPAELKALAKLLALKMGEGGPSLERELGKMSERGMDGTHAALVGSPLLGSDQLTPKVRGMVGSWPPGSTLLYTEWRRIAQLADHAVAMVTKPCFPCGKDDGPEIEKRFAMERVLPQHIRFGLPDYTAGVKKLWDGERDPAKLCEGQSEDGASIIRMLLRECIAQKRRIEAPVDTLTEDDIDHARQIIDSEMKPGERARRISARKAAADSNWPPPGITFPSFNCVHFTYVNEVALRRMAQLAIPEIAKRNKAATFGGSDIDTERGLARALLQQWARSGWILTDAVEAIWKGERSAQLLTSRLDPGSKTIVEVLLKVVEQESKHGKKGAPKVCTEQAPVEWEVFKGESGWSLYPPDDAAMLEEAREAGLDVLEEVTVSFSDFKYTFDLAKMKQTNVKTGKTREIRRREVVDPVRESVLPETPRSAPSVRKALFDVLDAVQLQPPRDPKQLQLWRKLLRRDAEERVRRENVQKLRHAMQDRVCVCPCLDACMDGTSPGQKEVGARLSQRALSPEEVESIVTEALVHYGSGYGETESDESGRFVVAEASLLFGLETACGLLKRVGGQKGHSSEQLQKLVGKNTHEKAMLEGLISPEDVGVHWDEVGGLGPTKELLREAAVYPLKYPELYQVGNVSVSPPGVLLFGPPGTGKTLLAKAVATETGASFLLVDSTSIGSKWYGESEKYARAVFTLARKVAPAVIFIDEIDSLAASRDSDERGTLATVKTTLLREWDGLAGGNQGVMVVGATNRPYTLDEAVLSRMPQRVLVDLPDSDELGQILTIRMKDVPKSPDLDLVAFAKEHLKGYVGRDIKELVRVVAHAAGHEIARKLEQLGATPGSTELQQARQAVGKEQLLAAKQKVKPLGGKEGEGHMVSQIREWMEKVGIEDPRKSSRGASAARSMYM